MKNFLLSYQKPFAAKILDGKLYFLVFAALFCFNNNVLAQAPTINYSTPPVYTVGQTITILTPSATGVAATGYGAPVIKGSGFNTATGIAADAAGNIYASYDAANTVYKIKATGGLAAVGTGFNNPQGVAVDAAGNVYVADAGNNAVKEVLATDGATVAIGSGFSKPSDVAIDAAGDLFIADLGNQDVEKIPVGGTKPVSIGSGFQQPTGIAVDAYGNVYVTDTGTGLISMINAFTGATTTIGPGISNPYGIAVDGSGNIYVTSTGSSAIIEIPAGGGSTIGIGSGFNGAKGVAINSSGNLYVGDTGNGDIKSLAPSGGFFISPELPQGLAFNNTTGAISGTPAVVSPATNYTILAYNSSGNASATINITVSAPQVTVSYTSPVAYLVNTAITTLVPTTTNSGNFEYNANPVNLATSLKDPWGVAVDAAGNAYVASFQSTQILKIPAGGGAPIVYATGFTDPFSIAVDATGNVFVGDQSAIKKIPAGGGTPVLLSSAFSQPFGIAVDAADNLYIADTNSALVSELPAGGGSPVAITSAVSDPYGVAVDGYGNVYIASYTDGTIKEVAAGSTVALNVVTGLAYPTGLAVDAAGDIYIASSGNNDIFITRPNNGGTITALSSFSNRALAVDAKGNLYVADAVDNEVRELIPTGGYFLNNALPQGLYFNIINGEITGTPKVAGPAANYTITARNAGATATAMLNLQVRTVAPVTLSYSSPQPYVVDAAITALYPTVQNQNSFGYNTAVVAVGSGFNSPAGVAVDGAGNVYVADEGNNAIKKIPASGGSPVVLGTGFSLPVGVAVDAAGNVYVADRGNHAVKRIPAGNGTPVAIGAGFSAPIGIAVDAAGNVYVGDTGLGAVMKIQAVGGATVAIGSGFSNPYGVAVDAAGNVYVADEGNNALKEIQAVGGATVTLASGIAEPTGVAVDASGDVYVNSYSGASVFFYPGNGTASVSVGSGFIHPYGLAVDAAGNVYVADIGKTTIQQVTPTGGYFIDKPVPAGLFFDDGDGTFSGTPKVTSPATVYTVTGYNVGGGTPAKVTLSVLPSSNAGLSNITVSEGVLSPAFVVTTNNYSDMVTNSTTSLTITPTSEDPNATITVNQTVVKSGVASGPIALAAGSNTITIVVTAQDGTTTQTYTLTVTRAASAVATLSALKPSKGTISPAFSSATTSYTENVVNGVTSLTITPTATDPAATIKVDGAAVASGSASQNLALVVGPNSFPIKVTAADGVTTKTYTLVVTRGPSANCYLSNLKPSAGGLTPSFSASKTAYTTAVVNGAATVTITPTTAVSTSTVTVNGTAVTSGTASSPIALNVGSNTITTIVTAQDGTTTRTYTLTVTRAASTNANLSAFKISKGTLTPAFATGTTTYTASVVNGVTSLTVTPTAADNTATITVNGTAVPSGTASGAIALAVGSNTITTFVTAQDGVTTDTYTLTVTRASGGADSYVPGISVTAPAETLKIADDGIVVHQAVSPNGDGINDFLQIDNISQYPDNKLMIMNRNGQLVYEANGYDNSSKVFDGHSSKNGQMQLPGTYFYQLDYTSNGITKHKTGFLVLKY